MKSIRNKPPSDVGVMSLIDHRKGMRQEAWLQQNSDVAEKGKDG